MISEAPVNAPARAVAHDHVELGADVGMVVRPLDSDVIRARPGLAYGAHLAVSPAPWLRIAPYYLYARQPLSFGANALGVAAPLAADGDLTSYVLGVRLEPTWNVTQRLHLFASAGAGWGVIKAPRLSTGGAGSFDVAARDGVWLELPLGVGGVLDVIPQWMAVTLDAAWGPVMAQTGQLFDRAQVIAGGAMSHVEGMPAWQSSFTLVVGATLRL